jgi:hypothetical protein
MCKYVDIEFSNPLFIKYTYTQRNIKGQATLLRTVGGVSRSTSGSGSTRRDAALEF